MRDQPKNSVRDQRKDFGPTAPWENLEKRARMLAAVRRFFDERGYLEVETPYLSHDTVVDRHLDPVEAFFIADAAGPDAARRAVRCFLQTSPELGMKRLLAAGGKAIYQIARVFRNGEVGPRHNPEFTMVEWYRAGDDHHAQMTVTGDLVSTLLELPPADRISYADAFMNTLGLDPHAAPVEVLQDACRRQNINIPESMESDDRDGLLDLLTSEVIQPTLGAGRPTMLYDYPASQAAMAKVGIDHAGRSVAERFECYFEGLELANGYHELLDPAPLRKRQTEQNAWRARDRKGVLPEENRLLAAMEAGLPACSGVALGFDRLLMKAVGAKCIHEVLAFPFERA